MAISTYTELKTAIIAWAKRGDILTLVDDFIDLAEADMWSGPAIAGASPLRIRDMETRATATTSTTSRFLELPESFVSMRKLVLISGTERYDLKQYTPESIKIGPDPGIPYSFSVTSQLEFDKITSSAMTAEMQYYRQLTALSSSAPSNQILTRFPSVYLCGALFHFANWAMNDDMVLKYGVMFSNAINSANKTDRKGRHGPAPAMKFEGSTP